MDESSIRKYAKLMKELELTGLEIKGDDLEIRLERNVEQRSASTFVSEQGDERTQQRQDAGLQTITSPMVGVFYQASREDAPPFVSIGDEIAVGDTLCIIEAMKLMNEVKAEISGVVEQILVKNGEIVGFGAPLFAIRRNHG